MTYIDELVLSFLFSIQDIIIIIGIVDAKHSEEILSILAVRRWFLSGQHCQSLRQTLHRPRRTSILPHASILIDIRVTHF